MGFVDFLRSLVDDPRKRLGEHLAAERSQGTDAPIVGGLYNAPGIGIPARVAGGVLNTVGLAAEPFSKVANAGAGEVALLAALGQVKLGDPNNVSTRASQHVLDEGSILHPGRAIGAMRSGDDRGAAVLGAILEMATNPLNYAGGIGEAGSAIRAGGQALEAGGQAPRVASAAQLLGKVLQGTGLAGEAVNRASLPIGLATKGGRAALFEAPAFMREAGPQLSSQARQTLDQIARMEVGPPLAPLADVGPRMPNERGNPRGFQGPQLPPELGPTLANLPPELGPQLPTRGNVPFDQLIPGIGRNGGKGIGPILNPEQRPQLPPELGPQLPTRGNVPPDQLLPGVGRNGGKGLGPLLPEAAQPPKPLFDQAPIAAAEVGRGEQPSAPLTQTLDDGQRQMVDSYRSLLAGGSERDAADFADFLRETMGVRDDTLARIKEEATRLADAETKAASLERIESSPYFQAFRFFDKRGDLKPTNPITGKRLRAKPSVGDLTGNGYDELAANLLDEHGGDTYNQNTAMTTEEFWTNAQRAFKEYQGLRAVKRVADEGVPKFAPAEAVTTAEEAAAKLAPEPPDLQAPFLPRDVPQVAPQGPAALAGMDVPEMPASRSEALQGLSPTDVTKLVSLAYNDVPKAIRNARNARPDQVDLVERAIERIQTGKGLAAQLTQRHPDLAEWVAALPDNVDIPATDTATTIAKGKAAKADLFSDAGDLAAGGGGGGGMGIAPYVLPAAASRSLVGVGIGGAVGGAAGAIQDGDDRMGGFTRGAVIGMGAGAAIANADAVGQAGAQALANLPTHLHGMVISPELQSGAIEAGVANQAAVDAAKGVQGAGRQIGAARAQWRAQMVNTLKQLPQDAFQQAITRWGIAGKEFGVTAADARRWQAGLAAERSTGVSMLNNPVTSWLRDLGLTERLADTGQTYGIDFGGSLTEGADKQLGTGQRMAASAAMSGFAGTPSINPITLAVGAIKGKYQPFIDGYIRFLNGIQHDAARFAMAEKALDRDVPVVADAFLDQLAAQGHDVTKLRATGGHFSADDVAALAGAKAGQDWHGLVDSLVAGQGDRIAFLNGDFRKSSETRIERGIGNVAPFARWSIRYAPVLAEIAARHPRAAMLVSQEMQRENAQAKEDGKPTYQRGVTITDETPLLGLYARFRNAGRKGETTLDPLGAAMPYGSLLGGGEDVPEDATAYQKVVNLAGKLGLSPDPSIQAAAYLTGKDYRAPGNLSRTAGLEAGVGGLPALARLGLLETGHKDLASAIPDLPELPSGRALLDAGRELLYPVSGKHAVQASDPATKRYGEILFSKTGKTLDDPANREYLATIGKPDNALWQQAVLEAALAGAATNAIGMASPVQTTAQTAEARAAQQAKAAMPVPGVPSFVPSSIQDRALLPPAALAARRANAAYVANNPAAAMYGITNRDDATATLVRGLVQRYEKLGLSATQAQTQAEYDFLYGGPLVGIELFPNGTAPRFGR